MGYLQNKTVVINDSQEGYFSKATTYGVGVLPVFQGSVAGYSAGGSASGITSNIIDKFPFSTDASATNNASLSEQRAQSTAGHSSETHGFSAGGSPPPNGSSNTIERWPFASNTNASDVGDLYEARGSATGHSASIPGIGYTSGGAIGPFPPYRSTIDKFPFASGGTATLVGNLTVARYGLAGSSSTTHGYHTNSNVPPNNRIDKFSFSSDGNATTVGNLSNTRSFGAGQSSTTDGYVSGGFGPSFSSSIDRISFASDAPSVNIGYFLVTARQNSSGQSSTTHGYTSGGFGPPPSPFGDNSNQIDKFPFSNNANATTVGNLSSRRTNDSGQQD